MWLHIFTIIICNPCTCLCLASFRTGYVWIPAWIVAFYCSHFIKTTAEIILPLVRLSHTTRIIIMEHYLKWLSTTSSRENHTFISSRSKFGACFEFSFVWRFDFIIDSCFDRRLSQTTWSFNVASMEQNYGPFSWQPFFDK